MDCLATLNIGDYLCDNARASFLAAANRWGVDYVEVTVSAGERFNPCYGKLPLLHRLTHYDHVAYFDADILIRNDTPSPFRQFNGDRFHAVHDLPPNRHSPHSMVAQIVRNEAHIPWFRKVEERFGRGLELRSFCENFFNAGLIICSPKKSRDILGPIMAEIARPDFAYADAGRYEQAMLNYFAQLSGRLCLIDEAWNFISPPLENETMHTWVYHFTGFNGHLIKNRVKDFPWCTRPVDASG